MEVVELGCTFSRPDRHTLGYSDKSGGAHDSVSADDCAGVERRISQNQDRLTVSFDTIYPSVGDRFTVRLRACMEQTGPPGATSANCGGFGVDSGKSVTIEAVQSQAGFAQQVYEYIVQRNASTGTSLGVVEVNAEAGATYEYSITEGNGGGQFDIDSASGEITVADSAALRMQASYVLTVQATPSAGGSDRRSTQPGGTGQALTTTVEITVEHECSNGTVVTNPSSSPGLVGDCRVLLDLEDDLAGSATLNWDEGTAITAWDGVTVSGTPGRVTGIDLRSEGLTGHIPGELVDLTELATLRLGGNQLTGCIPSSLHSVATNDLGSLGLNDCDPDPLVEISGLAASLEEDLDDYFSVTVTELDPASSYTIEVATDSAGIGLEGSCSDNQQSIAVPTGVSSYAVGVRLVTCDTPGGAVTVTLHSGGVAVASESQDVAVTAAPSGPRVFFNSLVDGLTAREGHRFEVRADNLSSSATYTIELRARGGMGFGASCGSQSSDLTVSAGSQDYTGTIRLHGCASPGGTVTATLVSAGTTVATATRDVTVAAVPNSVAAGPPTISGTVQVGETLTADMSGISDADGLSRASYSYQWVSSDGVTDTDIAGAAGSAYTLVGADEGKTIKVRVSFADDAGNAEMLTSAATPVVAARPNTAATGAPTIGGTVQAGETLIADTSGIADADGLANVTYSYQWVSSDGVTDTDIAGAAGSTYTLVDADEGKTIKVRVSFADDWGNEETLTSVGTAVGGGEAEHGGERDADDRRDCAGDRDADGGHLGDSGRRRPDRCEL